MSHGSVLNTASHIMQSIIGRGPLDKCFNASVAIVGGAGAVSLSMEYQANPSLTAVFGKYVLPVVAAAVAGAIVADDGPVGPAPYRTFHDFKRDFQKSNVICAVASATFMAGLLVLSTAVKSSDHDHEIIQKEKAAAIAAKPVMAPNTFVQTTAQKLACGKQKNGVGVFVNEADGIEYQVSCTPAP